VQAQAYQGIGRVAPGRPALRISLAEVRKGKRSQLLLKFITNPGEWEEAWAAEWEEDEVQLQDLLALRGLLACGLLVHCLQRRHRVDYGIKHGGSAGAGGDSGVGTRTSAYGPGCAPGEAIGSPKADQEDRKTRLAVPFRAADTPSERSLFAHPDTSILYTTLAHYGDGLTPDALHQAFKALTACDEEERSKIYELWFSLSSPLDPADATSLDRVSKIDLSNDVQKVLLVRDFSANFETINFWLSRVVFPEETQQYQERLAATPWHLCDSPNRPPVGFSGTDDNKLLLPLQVLRLAVFSHTNYVSITTATQPELSADLPLHTYRSSR
jgi:hypothetical protein